MFQILIYICASDYLILSYLISQHLSFELHIIAKDKINSTTIQQPKSDAPDLPVI